MLADCIAGGLGKSSRRAQSERGQRLEMALGPPVTSRTTTWRSLTWRAGTIGAGGQRGWLAFRARGPSASNGPAPRSQLLCGHPEGPSGKCRSARTAASRRSGPDFAASSRRLSFLPFGARRKPCTLVTAREPPGLATKPDATLGCRCTRRGGGHARNRAARCRVLFGTVRSAELAGPARAPP